MKPFIVIIIALLLFPLVSASITVEYIGSTTLKADVPHTLLAEAYNDTTGIFFSGASCTGALFNIQGKLLGKQAALASSQAYSFTFNESNFTNGDYSFTVICNTSTVGGNVNQELKVTPNGENPSTGKILFYIGILFVLIIFFLIFMYVFQESEHLWVRAGFSVGMYMMLIAFSFVVWQMTSDYMTETFLPAFMRIIYITLIAGFFPFVLLLTAYGFYIMFTIKEIKEMTERGISFDEAERRAGYGY